MNIYDTDVGVAVRLSFTFSRPPEDFFKRDSVVLERTYGCSETIKGRRGGERRYTHTLLGAKRWRC